LNSLTEAARRIQEEAGTPGKPANLVINEPRIDAETALAVSSGVITPGEAADYKQSLVSRDYVTSLEVDMVPEERVKPDSEEDDE